MNERRPTGGRADFGVGVLRPLILGVLLGGAATEVLTGGPVTRWIASRVAPPPAVHLQGREPGPMSPPEFLKQSDWHYLEVGENGWTTGRAGRYQDLNDRLERPDDRGTGIVIPVFPTVYAPTIADKLYYDAILASDIGPGDKVLVIGTGSGADAWVASLKSRTRVHVVEINPMAVVNARVTARLGGFEITAITGDITTVELPDGFSDFDFVLWNMPFLEPADLLEGRNFHDGDNGRLLRGFLDRLPSLLGPGGKAIVLNVSAAQEIIDAPGVVTVKGGRAMPPPYVGEPGAAEAETGTATDFDREFMLFVIPKP